jgi:hypothetical protein
MSGAYLVFHIAMVAMVSTGYFLGMSAPDVGPLAPVVAYAGAAMMMFSCIAESLFVSVCLFKLAHSKWARFRSTHEK